MPRPWYSIRAKTLGDERVAEILIYDEIGFWGTTAKAFVNELDAVVASANATRILVSINSPGGNVFDANAIYNTLLRHPLPVTTRVDGVAASAASLIFMAGGERIMPGNAMLMIHHAWTVAAGTAEELRAEADMMDKVRNGVVTAYARSGQADDEIIAMMDATTWLDAGEAMDKGFATALEEPVKLAASARAVDLLARHKGVPAALLAELDDADSDPAPSSQPTPEPSPPVPEDPVPQPAPAPPPPPVPANSAEMVAHVYAECRSRRIPHMAEGVLVSSDLTDRTSVNARVAVAEQVAGLCLAASVPDRAADFIMAGLGVEQVRSRLLDHMFETRNANPVSNLQRPPSPSAPSQSSGPNPSAIYAARKTLSAR
ncbi:Clp protease ClpP [Verticiella sediminum]|uniref:ATP-dependent Clp protease proteolytic subunit n=1 Tax=Verticiella sediminum TaxID=1247510 RepID=A0A556AIC3_9BURK|nr:head maturation protease, ClpP-related [Verticiella sediminum]TSH92632.1 Clp protease ClpP [Verticiella sediminum]